MGKKIKNINYSEWDESLKLLDTNFSDKEYYKFFLKYALLAPSSHNTQPWHFTVNDSGVIISPDFSRRLESSDKNNRQLYISLGVSTAFFIVTANNFGYSASYFINDDGDINIVCKKNIDNIKNYSRLFVNIINRVTNRNKYLNSIDLNKIKYFSKYKVSGVISEFIWKDEIKNKIADIVISAGIEAMNDSLFREELSGYIKTNITKSFVGMPAYGMGIPLIASLFAPFLIKRINMNKITEKDDLNILKKHTPVFCILETERDTVFDWVKVGYQYGLYTLRATSLGMVTHPYAAPIQIGSNSFKLVSILKTKNHPQFFFRMGVPVKNTKHSPRLLSQDVISE